MELKVKDLLTDKGASPTAAPLTEIMDRFPNLNSRLTQDARIQMKIKMADAVLSQKPGTTPADCRKAAEATFIALATGLPAGITASANGNLSGTHVITETHGTFGPPQGIAGWFQSTMKYWFSNKDENQLRKDAPHLAFRRDSYEITDNRQTYKSADDKSSTTAEDRTQAVVGRLKDLTGGQPQPAMVLAGLVGSDALAKLLGSKFIDANRHAAFSLAEPGRTVVDAAGKTITVADAKDGVKWTVSKDSNFDYRISVEWQTYLKASDLPLHDNGAVAANIKADFIIDAKELHWYDRVSVSVPGGVRMSFTGQLKLA
jgi:hypothetical protein